jgi:hypothetical protein
MPRSLLLTALALLTVACANDIPEGSDGDVEGQVHLLGDLTPPPTSGVVQLYTSPQASDTRTAFRQGALTGGPADWTFHLAGVPEGTYYLGACFPGLGCGTHSDIEGQPAPVVVSGNQTTTTTFAF